MRLVEDKTQCCGCSACVESCPVKAISMIVDEEGFAYPSINKNICIGCGICKQVCAFKKTNPLKEQSYWELKSKNQEIRSRSRSGGAFLN